MKKVIILSGGIDSVTALYYEYEKGNELIALSFDYGSKHNDNELNFAKWHCKHLKIKHEIIKLDLNKYFNSSLLRHGQEIPEGSYKDKTMKSTVIPFRNGIMLAFAIGYAENIHAEEVIIGSHAGDHAIYPDCRETFTQAISLAGQLGTYNHVKVVSPFNNLMKWDIVKLGTGLHIPYNLTWSCYRGNKKHCGKCGTCIERKEAFKKAGVEDLTEYE